MSYSKLSNVVFGSDTNAIIEVKNNILYSSRPSFPALNKSKYTFVNPILDEGSARKNFSLSNQIPDLKSSSKSRFFNQK